MWQRGQWEVMVIGPVGLPHYNIPWRQSYRTITLWRIQSHLEMRWHSAPEELLLVIFSFFPLEIPCFVSSTILSFITSNLPSVFFMFPLLFFSVYLSLLSKALLFVPACLALYFIYFTLSPLFLSFRVCDLYTHTLVHTHGYTHTHSRGYNQPERGWTSERQW